MEFASVTHEGFTVESNTETEAELRTSLGMTDEGTAAPAGDVTADPGDTGTDTPATETAAEQAARERDEKGRFAKGADDKKPVKAAQPRIDTLVYEREEARREAAREREARTELERRLAALESSKAPEKAAPAARVADPADAEPTEDKFEDYQKFLDAHARWSARDEIRQERAAASREAAVARRQQETHQVFSKYAERIDTAVKADPDFLSKLSPDVLALEPTSMLSREERPTALNALAEEITRSEHSDKLLVHFTEHPDDLRRFSTLHPRDFLREFLRLETRLDTAPAPASVPKTPSVSHAKPPVKAVTASPVVGDQPPGDDADDEAHRAYWNRRDKSERERRRA